MSLAILGTDTAVGKTLVAALLLERYGRELPLAYWKPVASGARDERDTTTVAALVGAPFVTHPEGYLLAEPLSPHLAARLEGVTIAPATLLAAWSEHRRGRRGLVVEGAGGALVPLTDAGDLLVDVVAAMEIAVLLVARSTLGTINHTLLTLEALRARRVEIAGVVMTGPPNAENRRAIETFGAVAVIAEVPRLPRVDAEAIAVVANTFDPSARLRSRLRSP